MKAGFFRFREDRVFDLVVRLLLALAAALIVFPFLFVFSSSLTPYEEVVKHGGFLLIPRKITLDAYRLLFDNFLLLGSFGNTVFITLVGTLCNMAVTILAAWPLSRKKLPGRNVIMVLATFTLMFSGGVIPTYLVVRGMKLLNSLWALIVPGLVWTGNLIILKNFMEALPEELIESAVIDGASDFRILVSIVMPLSVPILLTISVYYGVGHWNQFQSAILYITTPAKMPLQVILREILDTSQQNANIEQVLPTMTMQMAAVVFASLPMLLAYPFIQKGFVKGIMSGAIKG